MKQLLLVLLVLVPLTARDSLFIVCDLWPPYQYEPTDSTLSGYSVEVLEEVLKRMDTPSSTIVQYPWKRALMMVETGLCDALFSANYTKEREKFGLYPKEPFIVSPWVVWVRKDAPVQFDSLPDLQRYKAGVVRGYSYTKAFWAVVKEAKGYSEVRDDITNFLMLSEGRIDYTVAELGNGYEILRKKGLTNIIPIMAHPIKEDGLYIVFNKERVSSSFVAAFSDSLERFKKSEDYRLIYSRYFK